VREVDTSRESVILTLPAVVLEFAALVVRQLARLIAYAQVTIAVAGLMDPLARLDPDDQEGVRSALLVEAGYLLERGPDWRIGEIQ
jgi:hypothetical protein